VAAASKRLPRVLAIVGSVNIELSDCGENVSFTGKTRKAIEIGWKMVL
jgi:hypothetical protein